MIDKYEAAVVRELMEAEAVSNLDDRALAQLVFNLANHVRNAEDAGKRAMLADICARLKDTGHQDMADGLWDAMRRVNQWGLTERGHNK